MGGHYQGRRAALATMHGKASVIAPVMKDHLGLDVITPGGLDTDALGTFTGETPRVGSMREAAVRKARMGMAASGLKIGLASEGSFGPHPLMPFLPGGVEVMVLVDDERGLVISHSLIADHTNHDETTACSLSELRPFLARAGFPEHALVVGPNATSSPWWRLHPDLMRMRKGVRSEEELAQALTEAARRSDDGRARVMTDMRAHMNPTRMRSIAELAHALAGRISAECPSCGGPGFGPVRPAPGLPCRLCGEPSVIARGDILACPGCGHEQEQARAGIPAFADPGECPLCNP